MSEQDNLQQADGTIEPKKDNEAVQSTASASEDSLKEEASEQATKSEKAIDEINAENAKSAENEEHDGHHDDHDQYDDLSLEELLAAFEALLNHNKVQTIRARAERIRSVFSAKFSDILMKEKQAFLEAGGDSIDFRYENETKRKFSSLFKSYKSQRAEYYRNLQKTLEENLDNRLEIIDEIKSLLNVEEDINTTYKNFKALQERWRNAGPIPRDKYNNVWNNYHHHVENFYDFLHLNRDLRDLDFKHNLEQKLKIIERAEELAKDDDINRAFRELQALHKMWKEELGPVAREHREEIWERFSAATKAIHEKRHEYFEQLDSIYEKNLEHKQEIIEKINAVTATGADNHSGWQKRIKEIEALRSEFFKAGKVPIKVNEATWKAFKESVRAFNRKKNAFYKSLKKEQFKNLEAKLKLIEVAEANMDATDFKMTTPLMKKIQSDWKKIGHVPRKDSDKIWERFKKACNHYFDRLHEQQNEANKEEIEAFELKKALMDELKALMQVDTSDELLDIIKTIMTKWEQIGHVPYNKRFINKKFNKLLDQVLKHHNIDSKEAEMIKYEKKLSIILNKDSDRYLDNEHHFVRKKIDEIKAEINQLENNMLFFQHVDDDNPVVMEAQNNLKRHKEQLSLWKAKLKNIKKHL